MLHGVTPDEHTWSITFSYAIGSYSSRKGMKAGFTFSAGFTLQRAFLTTIGFLGFAAIYKTYNLDGPVYVIVGIAMLIAGAYILNKKRYMHLPFDLLLHKNIHSDRQNRVPKYESDVYATKDVPLKMAAVHGLIAGFGFGAYATILVFVLTPQLPNLLYAPLPGLFFGIGTTIMQIIFGAIFANLVKFKNIDEKHALAIGRKTSGRTLYYGGMLFAIIGLLIILFPVIDKIAISTGNPIPNLDSIGIATLLVFGTVGVFGIGNLIYSFIEISKVGKPTGKSEQRNK